MNKDKVILHLCADIGSDSQPYTDAGYTVVRIGKKVGVENYHPPANVYGVIANPPCTMFSFARTHAKTPRDLREGMRLVIECLRVIWECQYQIHSDQQKYSPLKFWVLENPNRGMLRWFLGKPAYSYSPYEYGDNYKKETALWGNFVMPQKIITSASAVMSKEELKLARTNLRALPKFDSLKTKDIHPEFYGQLTRQDRRSICSAKFAQAFFKANQ